MLLDFAKEYADVSFSQTPICNLDLLVFAQMACFDFPKACVGRTLLQAMPQVRTAALHMKSDAKADANDFGTCDFGESAPACALFNKEDVGLRASLRTPAAMKTLSFALS